jgi:hypothetical protein
MRFGTALLVLAVAIALGAWAYFEKSREAAPAPDATSTIPFYESTISDGVITIGYPAPEFGLAVRREQLPASYIPACDEGFAYCVYYAGEAHEGTNFESAGVRVSRRDDFKDRAACVGTQPEGYSGLTPVHASTTEYASATFAPTGDAGAGHYARGAIYRLAVADRCYELETRVGEAQFANFEPQAIREFTAADRAALEAELRNVVQAIQLPSGQRAVFPTPAAK